MAVRAVDLLLEAGGRWLESLNPSIPPWSGKEGTFYSVWFISSRQAFFELLFGAAVFIPVAWIAFSRSWPVLRPRSLRRYHCQPWVLRALDLVLRVTLALAVVATWWYKLHGAEGAGKLPFLLMPCHVLSHLYLFLSFVPWKTEAVNRLSYVVLLLSWATWPALAFPDTADLELPWEKEHFVLYHWVLLALPCCWLIRGRFHVYGGAWPLLAAASAMVVAETHVGTPAAVLSGYNVMYALRPPFPLTLAGTHYRVLMAFGVIPAFVVLTRFVFVGACLLLERALLCGDAENDCEGGTVDMQHPAASNSKSRPDSGKHD